VDPRFARKSRKLWHFWASIFAVKQGQGGKVGLGVLTSAGHLVSPKLESPVETHPYLVAESWFVESGLLPETSI
jgi:hypothetical protein